MKKLATIARRLTLAALGMVPLACGAADQVVEGWTVSPGDRPEICVASGVSDGQAQLSLGTTGPLFLMLVSASDFPQQKGAYQAELSFDGKAPVSAPALGENGTMQINVGRSGPAQTLVAASQMKVTVEGSSHQFPLSHLGNVLDALARCAGQPTLAQQDNRPPESIPGAGKWQLATTLPGAPGRACSARAPGPEIDTIMLLNDSSELVLLGGHSDWATWGGDVPLQLAVDGGAPTAMTAHTLINLITVLVQDPGLLKQLREAKTLDWTIPTGHVRGEVAGLGVALDAMKACKAATP